MEEPRPTFPWHIGCDSLLGFRVLSLLITWHGPAIIFSFFVALWEKTGDGGLSFHMVYNPAYGMALAPQASFKAAYSPALSLVSHVKIQPGQEFKGMRHPSIHTYPPHGSGPAWVSSWQWIYSILSFLSLNWDE